MFLASFVGLVGEISLRGFSSSSSSLFFCILCFCGEKWSMPDCQCILMCLSASWGCSFYKFRTLTWKWWFFIVLLFFLIRARSFISWMFLTFFACSWIYDWRLLGDVSCCLIIRLAMQPFICIGISMTYHSIWMLFNWRIMFITLLCSRMMMKRRRKRDHFLHSFSHQSFWR